MEKLIHEYLSEFYTLSLISESSKKLKLLDYDAIFKRNDSSTTKQMMFGDKLLKELVLVFYLDEVTLKKHVVTWAKKIKANVVLKWYWEKQDTLLPTAIRVAARTIAQDLVSVQPINRPTGTLFYSDFVYSGNTPNENGRSYRDDMLDAIMMAQFAIIGGELNHPEQ